MSNAAKWCIALGAILKDKTLTDQERADVEGVKKAMERQGHKKPKPLPPREQRMELRPYQNGAVLGKRGAITNEST